jgi:exopolyphosphatase/guanosine-5'-triphosphate,3'-diphosphate pyrophosphatase
VDRRAEIPGLSSDRADIILAGAVVLAEIMDHIGVDDLTISENGVREGLFFEQFWANSSEPIPENVRHFSIQNIARVYHYNQPHCDHVAFLARRLFSYLVPLHELEPTDLELLEAAAKLHDLGMIINHRDHDKNSQAIIIGNGLPGHSPRETALVGLMARYHRKGTPELGDFAPIMKRDDRVRLMKLTSLLRIAEYLDRGRSGVVENIRVDWDAHTITLRLYGQTIPEAEVWDTQRNAVALMEHIFDRSVVVQYVGRHDPALIP